MEHTHRDFTFYLIDEPLQSHVVEWEQAARKLRNDDVKPLITNVLAELNKVQIGTSAMGHIVQVFSAVAEAIKAALVIIETNETVTLSAHRGVMVKAAIRAGWILSPELSEEDVDSMQPWRVQWIAERVGELYLQATTVPKN